MNILLVCNGGLSTSVLMKKMEQWEKETGKEFKIKATSFAALLSHNFSSFDCFLVGPQISFRLDDLKEMTGLPGAAISSFDYALSNCEAIYKQAKALVDGK